MTNSNGNNNRLDRIEQILEGMITGAVQSNQRLDRLEQTIEQLATVAQTALTVSQSTRESLQQTEQLTRRNASAIARLEERMDQYITEGREHREFIANQVEGIKVETRRILTHLFGEADNQ